MPFFTDFAVDAITCEIVSRTDILIAIPCFRCAAQATRVVTKLTAHDGLQNADVVIVDNASDDGTAEAVREAVGGSDQFRILRNEENYGLGGSFKIAYREASSRGYGYLAFFHGDDQGAVEDLHTGYTIIHGNPRLAAALGARFMRGSSLRGYSKTREWANRALNVLFSILVRYRLYDLGSGVTIYRIAKLPTPLVERLPDHVAFDICLLLYFLREKLQVEFFPISWEEFDQKSTVRNIEVGLLLLQELGRWLLRRNPPPGRGYTDLRTREYHG